MTINEFPTISEIEYFRKRHKPGFTDGKTIYTNLYTGILMEEFIEEDLNILYVHEMIHTIDMSLTEKEVLWATKIILDFLRKL